MIQTAQGADGSNIQIHLQPVEHQGQLHGLGKRLGRAGSQSRHVFCRKAVANRLCFLCPTGKAGHDGFVYPDAGIVKILFAGILRPVFLQPCQHTGHTALHQHIPIRADMAGVHTRVGRAGMIQQVEQIGGIGIAVPQVMAAQLLAVRLHDIVMLKMGDEHRVTFHRQSTVLQQQTDKVCLLLHNGFLPGNDLLRFPAQLLFTVDHNHPTFPSFFFYYIRVICRRKEDKTKIALFEHIQLPTVPLCAMINGVML